MKKTLFATTALAAMAFGGVASAQGIALFGDARLGLGYNIENDGDVVLNDEGETDDDLRAVSRVRFGVNMTGETDSGITFGATIRADNAGDGQGSGFGQRAGNVFVSGAWGTLTFGDTNGADEQWVGDLNEVGLTCLGCQNETLFVSNGGGFGDDTGQNFANNENARPTVRYDFDIAGFGLSLSSNRDLTDVGVGGGYSGDFGGNSFTLGVGYYDFEEFEVVTGTETFTVIDEDGNPVEVQGEEILGEAPAGHQWSAALGGDFAGFSGKLIYTRGRTDGDGEFDTAGIGLGTVFDAWSADAYYVQVINADGETLGDADGLQSYGLGVTYDLGGGARIEGGVASVWDLGVADDGFVVADFGIGMAF